MQEPGVRSKTCRRIVQAVTQISKSENKKMDFQKRINFPVTSCVRLQLELRVKNVLNYQPT